MVTTVKYFFIYFSIKACCGCSSDVACTSNEYPYFFYGEVEKITAELLSYLSSLIEVSRGLDQTGNAHDILTKVHIRHVPFFNQVHHVDSQFMIFFFFYLGFTALSRIFHLYRANHSSKADENWRTQGKTT